MYFYGSYIINYLVDHWKNIKESLLGIKVNKSRLI